MLNEIDGVIFDLDGTLVDSMWIWSKIDLDFIEERGLQMTPAELMEAVAHFSFMETAQYFKTRFALPETIEEIAGIWNRQAEIHYTTNVFLKNGVREFLLSLKAQGIKMGVASSNSRHLVQSCLDSLAISHYFHTVVTTDESGAVSKSQPDVYLLAARRMAVEPDRTLVFEDVFSAMQGAKGAGMRVIGIKDKHTQLSDDSVLEICEAYLEDFTTLA